MRQSRLAQSRARRNTAPTQGRAAARDESATALFRQGLVALLPDLRGFARFLVRDAERADDLVQETVARALAGVSKYRHGTNLGAWTFTILRNLYYSQQRQLQHERSLPIDDTLAAPQGRSPQEARIEMRELRDALWRLPTQHREALLLVTVRGFKYHEAAKICGCATGTVKARVSLARARLERELGSETAQMLPTTGAAPHKSRN